MGSDKSVGKVFGRTQYARRVRATEGPEPPTSSKPRQRLLSGWKLFFWFIVYLERVMGIEPTSSAWEAEVLPLNHTR